MHSFFNRTNSKNSLLRGSSKASFFPANENGAHKLTNTSETERLVYIDFDTSNDLDVALYPDSGKIGIWGKEVNQIYKTDQNVAYFEGE